MFVFNIDMKSILILVVYLKCAEKVVKALDNRQFTFKNTIYHRKSINTDMKSVLKELLMTKNEDFLFVLQASVSKMKNNFA